MEPVQLGGVPLVHPHQHGGGLLPGGGVAGQELELAARPGHAGDHADVVGDGDVPPVVRHVVKGQLQPGQGLGQRAVAQGPHQHDRHLLPADIVLRTESAAGVHHAVGQGGLHIGVGPVRGGAVGKRGRARGGGIPAEHAAEHGHKLAPGQLLPHAEGAVGVAVHQAIALRLFDDLCGPGALRVGKCGAGRGGEGCGAQKQNGGQGCRTETVFHNNKPPCSKAINSIVPNPAQKHNKKTGKRGEPPYKISKNR